ncbi:TetR/AcrR family transcriptional regulator C-terminal domain-containing protein [Escherichia coli]|nr:TetR/AcrR family transcriptional regulator C-terminal domain-containing protein [Escherichia coli]
MALQEQAGAARRTGRSHAGGESYAFGAESRRRLALISDRECPQLRFLCEAGFSAGDAVNALMTISYFTVGAVLEEQAGDSDAGERGGTVEQAPLSPLLRAAIDAFDEAGPDAAFEQGLAVIVDGLAKRRLVVRNVEGPRKGDD